jgi:hypothetical protein
MANETTYETLAPAKQKAVYSCRDYEAACTHPGKFMLFVGARARARSDRWVRKHGFGSSYSLGNLTDPVPIRWPPVSTVRIVGSESLSYERLATIVSALLRDGVVEVEVPDRRDYSVTVYRAA